jgi:TPR repeat protein
MQLRSAADRGHRDYLRALNVAQKRRPDWKLAKELLLRAAKSGEPHAKWALATWYLHGNPVTTKDIRKAIPLLKQAAESVREAQYELAVCYQNGEGVAKSPRKAFLLYLQSALNGDPQAHFEVGRMLYHALGVRRDRAQAWIWLDKGRDLGAKDGNKKMIRPIRG